MTPPIINPATLTEEQIEEIRNAVKEIRNDAFPVCEYEEKLIFAEDAVSYFEWFFGSDLF